MIDLINSDAEIITSERDLDFGHVIKQNANAITVEYTNLNSLGQVYREYAYPDAFLEGVIHVKGDANSVLLREIELTKQFRAVNTSIELLEFDKDDPAYESLCAKRVKIKNALSRIQSEFEDKVKEKEIAQYRYYVDRDEKELENDLLTLARIIVEIKRLRDEISSFSGLKLTKKFRALKTSYEKELDRISTWTSSISRNEERLQGEYRFLGIDYELKYSNLKGATFEQISNSFADLELPFEKAAVGDKVVVFPFGFQIIEETPEGVLLKNENEYYIEYLIGENSRLRALKDDSKYSITRIERYDGKSAVRYVNGLDESKAFYYEEETIYGGAFYTYNVIRELGIDDDSEVVRDEVNRIHRML